MHGIDWRVSIEHQRRIGLPAALHCEVVDRARADALGLEPRPGLRGEGGVVLARLRRPGGEELTTRVPKRALQREPDTHPAVVVEIGVRDPGERRADCREGAGLRMCRLRGT
jgi:hypothetical protein